MPLSESINEGMSERPVPRLLLSLFPAAALEPMRTSFLVNVRGSLFRYKRQSFRAGRRRPEWLAPQFDLMAVGLAWRTSVARSGLMVLSAPATTSALVCFSTRRVMTAFGNLSAKLSTAIGAMRPACRETSRLRSTQETARGRVSKPSAVFFIAPDLPRSLGKRLPSSASFLSRVGHVRRGRIQDRRRMNPSGFGNYALPHNCDRQECHGPSCRARAPSWQATIVFERGFRFLDDADVVAHP